MIGIVRLAKATQVGVHWSWLHWKMPMWLERQTWSQKGQLWLLERQAGLLRRQARVLKCSLMLMRVALKRSALLLCLVGQPAALLCMLCIWQIPLISMQFFAGLLLVKLSSIAPISSALGIALPVGPLGVALSVCPMGIALSLPIRGDTMMPMKAWTSDNRSQSLIRANTQSSVIEHGYQSRPAENDDC